MKLKFYWWLFLGIILVSTTLIDVDHFIIEDGSITNLECMWHGFMGHTEEFYPCYDKGETHHGREFHHPYFWAVAVGLTIGGLIKRWGLDYSI